MFSVDTAMKEAIRQAMEGVPADAFAKQVGVSRNTLALCLSGISPSIQPRTWEKIKPHIEKYLPRDYKPVEFDSHSDSCSRHQIRNIVFDPDLKDSRKIFLLKILLSK